MRTTRKRLIAANEENMVSVLARYEDKMNCKGWTLDHSSILRGHSGLRWELYVDAYLPSSKFNKNHKFDEEKVEEITASDANQHFNRLKGCYHWSNK